jgi:hypothetical protein
LNNSNKKDLQKGLQNLRDSISVLGDLGKQFRDLPKYQEYREERRKRS